MKRGASKKLTKAEQAKLIIALEKPNLQVVQSFLQRGWNPAELINGANPLIYCDSSALVKFLISAGGDVNSGKDNWTPILVNSDTGKEDIVQLLIQSGADVNQAYSKKRDGQIPFGTTPLMKAANHGYLGIVRRLLTAGANINAVDEYGHNALFHALRGNQTDTAKELLRRGSMLTDDVLTAPVLNGDVELVRSLIAKKANDNCVFRSFGDDKMWPDGKTLLGYAIEQISQLEFTWGKRDVVAAYPATIAELLVKAGADVNQPSRSFVVRRERDKEILDAQPVSPLRIAGRKGLEKVMELLWKAGAKASLPEAMADCSLDKACFRGNIAVVKLLIRAGADVNAPLHEGKRPIEWARLNGHSEIVEILKKAGAKD